MRLTLSPTLYLVWRDFAIACQRQRSSIYLVRDLQDVTFARKLRIWFLVCPY